MSTPASAAVVFFDDFDAENGGNTVLNYNSFANFSVIGGVDLVATPNGFGIACADSCVDLDGTTGPGRLTSLASYAFNTGDMVRLTFDLSGNQRSGTFDQFGAGFNFDSAAQLTNVGFNYNGTDTILFPTLTNSSIFRSGTSVGTEPFSTRSVFFTAAESGSFTFSLGSNSSYNIGPVLDNVSLQIAPAPEPATWAFMIVGVGAIGAAMRRQRKVITRSATPKLQLL